MNNIKKRFLLYSFGCITVRFLLVYLVKTVDRKYLPYLGYIGLIPAVGFFIIYLGGLRKRGLETFGDNIWWNCLRPIHSILYLLFSYLAIFKQSKYSYIPLLLDVILGRISFMIYHYINGSYKKLFGT